MNDRDERSDERAGGLFAWQRRNYPEVHRDRKNLVVHALTVPLFWGGTVALVAALPLGSAWMALAGVLGLVVPVVAQGRGHAREAVPPAPFRGPVDVVARLFAEQWVTFPRFVLSGAFARAWQRAEG